MKKVFTFWEPKESVPGYVRLCMDTWARNLPGYEVVVLDRESLRDYLTAEELAEIDCPAESLAKQADCIRCALLNKYGGIWLDADTVLTKPLDARFTSSEVTMVARREASGPVIYGAYIHAARPGTRLVSEWYRQLLPRISRSRTLRGGWMRRLLDRRGWKQVRGWSYFENDILDPLVAHVDPADCALVDKDEVGAFPEESLYGREDVDGPHSAYVNYWFSPGPADKAFADCAGIIMLHNSWTPERFRAMSEQEFLATNTRLADVLRVLTGK